ncbi:MAG: 30S ribosomal protein S2 [Candidatus Portnoybacteria bacterium]|nr:30S ribosomal protein S2 [Candidatus Portnoybacteria bacterium]MDD4982968.1 30S ribosomal protein S2 [Candidatus Portnoybacteria bacterium]
MTEEKNSIIEVKLSSAEEMVEAGVHIGHQTSRWDPKMEQYIFGARNGIHVFDIEKTLKKLEEALVFMARVITNGGKIVFVGTKPAAKAIVREAAKELNMPYVVDRWLGGTLTNYKTISKRIQYLKDLEAQSTGGAWEKFTKKEQLDLRRKMEKLQGQLIGIRDLNKLPEAVFVADVKIDNIALREAKKIKIPVIAICDSNMNPALANYAIPANDDASSSLKMIMANIADNLKRVKPIVKAVEK